MLNIGVETIINVYHNYSCIYKCNIVKKSKEKGRNEWNSVLVIENDEHNISWQ
jgi:hypothetical protein